MRIVKTCLWFLLYCALAVTTTAQQLQPASVTLTKGTLSFDSKAVVFHSKDKEQRYPIPEQKMFKFPQIPGLHVQSFQFRQALPSGGGPPKDVSRLTLVADDRSTIELITGESVEVYRIEITFADQHQLTLWQLASKLQ
jgi:hypothetical protein